MSKTATQNKTQHFGFAVIGDKLRMAEPAATEETAIARAQKIAEKAGAGVVPTLTVEAKSRDEARKAASEAWANFDSEETGEDFEPTEADLAAAAAPREKADPAATAATRTARSGFYTVGVRNGETVASAVPVRDADTALGQAFDGEDVVAVKAKNRDEAINRYEALEGTLPESRVVNGTTRRTGGGGGRKREIKPITNGDTIETWKPTENADGTYWISKTGVLHSAKECRFVKENTPTASGKNLVRKVLVNRMSEETLSKLPKSDDDRYTATVVCASCSGTKIKKAESAKADVA